MSLAKNGEGIDQLETFITKTKPGELKIREEKLKITINDIITKKKTDLKNILNANVV